MKVILILVMVLFVAGCANDMPTELSDQLDELGAEKVNPIAGKAVYLGNGVSDVYYLDSDCNVSEDSIFFEDKCYYDLFPYMQDNSIYSRYENHLVDVSCNNDQLVVEIVLCDNVCIDGSCS
jgi:hypothetical protein